MNTWLSNYVPSPSERDTVLLRGRFRRRGTWRADPSRMLRFMAHGLMLAALLAGIGMPVGCYVEEIPPPAYVDGYEPEFYDGYVVYYDDVGRPFYYVNDVVVWISPESPHYGRLVHHWRVYGRAYPRWYVHHGYRYRTYRRR